MKRIIRRMSTAVYALGVLCALTFGASQAFGRAVYLTCKYDPPTWLGACVNWDQSECTARCDSLNPGAEGRCVTGDPQGCCICLLK